METTDTLGGDSHNTGWRGGSNAHLERTLGCKYHWCVWASHSKELPLHHLIEKEDGKTNSKDGFTGPIGKLLGKVMEMEINPDFEALSGREDYEAKNLKLILKFCIYSYFNMYFDIKVKHHLIHGHYHSNPYTAVYPSISAKTSQGHCDTIGAIWSLVEAQSVCPALPARKP